MRMLGQQRRTMLCGCPIEPGGLWDADEMRITVRLFRDGRTVDQADLTWSGEASTFTGSLEADRPGRYRIELLALQPAAGNFGHATRTVVVR